MTLARDVEIQSRSTVLARPQRDWRHAEAAWRFSSRTWREEEGEGKERRRERQLDVKRAMEEMDAVRGEEVMDWIVWANAEEGCIIRAQLVRHFRMGQIPTKM